MSLEQHRLFAAWVYENQARFLAVLRERERLCGEWLAQAHGTRYELQPRDWDQLGRIAHDLKSDGGNLGARSLSALCDELQAAARLPNAEGCAALVPRLAAEFEDVPRGLSEILAS